MQIRRVICHIWLDRYGDGAAYWQMEGTAKLGKRTKTNLPHCIVWLRKVSLCLDVMIVMGGHLMFEGHGSFKIHAIENVVVAKLYGYWNMPVANEFAQELNTLFQSLQGSRWSAVIIISDWGLGIPETIELIENLEVFAQSFGLSHLAFFYKTDIQIYTVEANVISHPEVIRFKSTSLVECVSFLNKADFKISVKCIEDLDL